MREISGGIHTRGIKEKLKRRRKIKDSVREIDETEEKIFGKKERETDEEKERKRNLNISILEI